MLHFFVLKAGAKTLQITDFLISLFHITILSMNFSYYISTGNTLQEFNVISL
jgi:hypothetical protein